MRRFDPGDEVWREQRAGAIIASGGALLVEPAVRSEMAANLVFECELSVQIHGRYALPPSPDGRGAGGEGTLRIR